MLTKLEFATERILIPAFLITLFVAPFILFISEADVSSPLFIIIACAMGLMTFVVFACHAAIVYQRRDNNIAVLRY